MPISKEKALKIFRHAVALTFIGFFLVSFFVGATIDPEFVDIARSPYGLFAYVLITMLPVFVPSFTTIPVVLTATFIWGPWIAGVIALFGWTIAGIVEYSAGYFAKDSIISFVNGGNNLEKKVDRVSGNISFWQLAIARSFVPSFIFGMVKVDFNRYIWVTLVNFIPLAAISVISGELIKPFFEQLRPWIMGLALIIMLFVIDYFFIKKDNPDDTATTIQKKLIDPTTKD